MAYVGGETSEFGPWRNFLWPIHRHELKKLLPMFIIFFFISFNYNVLHTLKDTLLITAKSSGAEVIPFVKVWAMFPGAILMTLLYTKLSNRFKRETVFYLIISIFLGYFFIFTFVLYPIRDTIHPHAAADALEAILPLGLKGLIAMFRYWTFTLFYVMSELWSNIVFSVLFWGFANQVTKYGEARRFYGVFGVGANFSGIAAGQISVYLCRKEFNPLLPFGNNAWEQSLICLVSLILLAGFISIALFRWLNTHVLTDSRFYDSEDASQSEVKGKLSFRQNFRHLISSNYLICIAAIVISYNIVINLCEVLWKNQVSELYPNPNEYAIYMNQVISLVGVFATFFALCVSGNSIRKFGWTFTAYLTPLVLLITSIGFFSFFFLKELRIEGLIAILGSSPLMMVVFWGSAQNVLSRAAKYSVFDATKEMTFVPLPAESKLMGKAAIDGVCSRLGKSTGAMIYQTLFLKFSTISASSPYIAGFLFFTIGIWMTAIRILGKKFNALTGDQKLYPIKSEELIPVRVPLQSQLEPLRTTGT